MAMLYLPSVYACAKQDDAASVRNVDRHHDVQGVTQEAFLMMLGMDMVCLNCAEHRTRA